MKKSSKKFALSTEAKNDKGFRVRTAGIDITGYQKNPIMLYMHQRPTGKNVNEVGVIGNMVDLHKKDNILWGTPSFDDTDDFAVKLSKKVENEVIRMCSAGLLPVEWSKDEAGDIWLEKSKAVEMSIADIGSNPEALSVNLCNESGELITLSLDQIQDNLKTENKMKIVKLSAGAVALGLSATLETETAVEEAVHKLVQLATDANAEVLKLTGDLATANGEKKTAEDALEASEKLATETKHKAIVALAVTEGKIVKGDEPKYIALMGKAPEVTKELLEGMPKNESVMQQLKNKDNADNPLVKLSYDELFKSGQLETLKAELPEVFKEKYKARWNKDYVEA